MSEENVETLRRANDAFNQRDKAAWLALFDADVVMVPAREWPEHAPVRGADALWDYYTEVVTGAWEEGSSGVLGEVVDPGGDTVVVNLRREAHGKASGAPFEFSYWCVTTFRQGRQVRADWFSNREEALEAAGLSE
jgi:ketosteroid isomerase-like protein